MGPVHKYPNFSTRSFKTDPPKTRACGNWKQSNREINLCIGIDQRKIEVNSQILEKKWRRNWHQRNATASSTTVCCFCLILGFRRLKTVFGVFSISVKQFYCKVQSKHIEVGIKGNPPYLNVCFSFPFAFDSCFV
jgi:hypothetical protein